MYVESVRADLIKTRDDIDSYNIAADSGDVPLSFVFNLYLFIFSRPTNFVHTTRP